MKHRNFKTAISLVLVVLMVISMMPAITIASSAADTYTWTRVTSVATLLAGGEFIIGYEATANSGVIIPMANTGTATTSAAGFMHSGATVSSGDKTTLDMTTYAGDGAAFIVTIAESTATAGNITIKTADGYIGNANTKNNCKLFAEDTTANGTSFTPTVGSNDVFTLKNANTTYHTFQYNSSSPRFCCYGGTQRNLVIYQRTVVPAAHEHAYAWNNEVGTDGSHTLACANTDGKCDVLTTTEDCTWEDGYCSVCSAEAPDCAHPTTTEVAEIPATCTEIGYTAGVQCTVCNQYTSGHEEIEALDHHLVTDAAVGATCTETGLTEGSHCDREGCGHIEVAQTVVDALGHDYVDGYCSRCNTPVPLFYTFDYTTGTNGTQISGEQEGLVTLAYDKADGSTKPTWYSTGTALRFYKNNNLKISTVEGYYIKSVTLIITEGSIAPDSGTLTDGTWTPADKETTTVIFTPSATTRVQKISIEIAAVCEHTNTEAIGEPKDATCTEDGITAGVKCTVCGETITAQETIPATGHNFVGGVCTNEGCDEIACDHVDKGITLGEVTKEASCTETGLQEQFCAQCGQPLEDKVLDKIAHTPETDAAVDATCTATGLTEGSHCSVCKEVLVEQTEVPMVAHDYVDGTCSVCGDIVVTGDHLADFEFGENGDASHKDGNAIDGTAYTSGDYSLTLTDYANVYDGAFDAKGNSALKLGTGSAAASFSFTVPSNVNTVVIYVAGYKANTAKVDVNGTEYEITSKSDEGAYTKIVVDTTSNKTVTLTTLSGGYRAMLNSIEFWGARFKSVSLSLDGMIGVTIKVAGWQDGYSVKFKLGDGTEETFEKASFTRWINASEMLETITVTLYGDDGETELDIQTFNAETYVDAVKAQYASDTKLCALVDALLTYGKYAAVYMGDTVADLGDLSAPSFEGLGVTVSASATGYTAKAVLNEACDLVISLPEGFNGTLTVDGEAVTVDGNTYTVKTIAAQNWADRYHIVATVGNETMLDVTMSVLDYLAEIVGSAEQKTVNLAHAMYSLNKAADEYLNKAAE